MTWVLMLHRLLPTEPVAFGRPSCYRLRGTVLSGEEFERLLDTGPFRTLEEVIAALAAGESPPPGYVLTWDDGYREWIDEVAPRLDRRGIPATFFVCPAFVQETLAAHPVDVFYWLLDHARRPRFELCLPEGLSVQGSLESDEAKLTLIKGDLKRFVVTGPREEVREVLTRLARSLDLEIPGDLSRRLYPSMRELQALGAAGHHLGAHGMRHLHLTRLSAGEAEQELAASLSWVRALSPSRPVPFAYPDGAFHEQLARQVEQAGALCGLTCAPGCVTRGMDLFQLPREFVRPGHRLLLGGTSAHG